MGRLRTWSDKWSRDSEAEAHGPPQEEEMTSKKGRASYVGQENPLNALADVSTGGPPKPKANISASAGHVSVDLDLDDHIDVKVMATLRLLEYTLVGLHPHPQQTRTNTRSWTKSTTRVTRRPGTR